MSEVIIRKKAGPFRAMLRGGMQLASRFFPNKPTVRQTVYHGLPLVVWANEHIGRRILLSGRFEDDEVQRFAGLVSEGDICLDVGANVGTHTLTLAARVGQLGQVIAFEPIRRNALLVELNASLNGFGNIRVEPTPLSDESGKRFALAMPSGDSGYAYFSEAATGIESITIDDYCYGRQLSPSFIKIDVEGAEYSVLSGAKKVLRAGTVRCVVVEMVDEYLARFNASVVKLCALMTECGYTPHAVRGGDLRAVTPSEISAENVYFMA